MGRRPCCAKHSAITSRWNASSSTRTILAEPVTRDPFLPGLRGIFQSNHHTLPAADLGIKQGARFRELSGFSLRAV